MQDQINTQNNVRSIRRTPYCNSVKKSFATDSKNKMLISRINNFLSNQNIAFTENTTQAMIAGGIAPSPISGQLGYGTASSGFINTTLYGPNSNTEVSVYDC